MFIESEYTIHTIFQDWFAQDFSSLSVHVNIIDREYSTKNS